MSNFKSIPDRIKAKAMKLLMETRLGQRNALQVNKLLKDYNLRYCAKTGKLWHTDQFYLKSSGRFQGYSIIGYKIWNMNRRGLEFVWNETDRIQCDGSIGDAAVVTNATRDELNGVEVVDRGFAEYVRSQGFDNLSAVYRAKGNAFRSGDSQEYERTTYIIEKVDPLGLLLHGAWKHGVSAKAIMNMTDEAIGGQHEYTYAMFAKWLGKEELTPSTMLKWGAAAYVIHHIKDRESLGMD